jgi:hypothetical protein
MQAPRSEEPVAQAQSQPQPEQPREPVNGAGSEGWGEGPQPSFLKRPSGGRRGRPRRESSEGESAPADDTPAES